MTEWQKDEREKGRRYGRSEWARKEKGTINKDVGKECGKRMSERQKSGSESQRKEIGRRV